MNIEQFFKGDTWLMVLLGILAFIVVFIIIPLPFDGHIKDDAFCSF